MSKSEPYRVLHVFNWFNQGGIENFVMNVYRNIDREKIQFDFAFLNSKKGYFDDEAISMGARIFHYDTEKNSFSNHRNSLKRIINENGPYIAVHSHIYFFSGYITQIAKECNVPVRISHSHETKKGRKETVMRKVYECAMRSMIKRNATHMLGCSEAACKALFGDNSDYQVVYNGIDLDRFCYSKHSRDIYREKLGLHNKFVILNVGRFADQKNHLFIVDFFEQVSKLISNAVLILIGTGPLYEDVKKVVEEKGLLDKVVFFAGIKNTEDYYNASDVFVLPSKYEGMGIVAIEAQATGLYTLLSSNITREVAKTDIVEYLDIDNAEVWARRLLDLYRLKCVRNDYSASLEETPFNIKKTVRDLEMVYMSSITEKE